MKLFNCTAFLTAVIALTVAAGANAVEKTVVKPALGVLSAVKSAELPAKAAELVTQADPKFLKETTIEVVKAAVGLNPAAAPAIVGSIAQSSPDMAATAAATAVTLVPNQELLIVRAAAAAAPAKAGAIVEAVCRVLPADYQKVAIAVADVVPGAGKEILAGIAAAIPELKNSIDQLLATYAGGIPSVSTALTQVAQTQNATAITSLSSGGLAGSSSGSSGGTPVLLPQGPGAVPPQVPIVTGGPVLNPTNGTPAPPGGNSYSAP